MTGKLFLAIRRGPTSDYLDNKLPPGSSLQPFLPFHGFASGWVMLQVNDLPVIICLGGLAMA